MRKLASLLVLVAAPATTHIACDSGGDAGCADDEVFDYEPATTAITLDGEALAFSCGTAWDGEIVGEGVDVFVTGAGGDLQVSMPPALAPGSYDCDAGQTFVSLQRGNQAIFSSMSCSFTVETAGPLGGRIVIRNLTATSADGATLAADVIDVAHSSSFPAG
jgi:hypothetical protein